MRILISVAIIVGIGLFSVYVLGAGEDNVDSVEKGSCIEREAGEFTDLDVVDCTPGTDLVIAKASSPGSCPPTAEWYIQETSGKGNVLCLKEYGD